MHDNEKNLDKMLDGALAGYSAAEPRSGLEGRIIARLSAASASRDTEKTSWLRWWPAIGFAAAAVIAVAVFFAMPKTKSADPTPDRTHDRVIVKQVAPTAIRPAVQQPTQVARLTPAPRVHAIHSAPPLPKQLATQQPAKPLLAGSVQQEAILGSPLSEQERLLLAYLRRTPAQEIVTQAKPDEVPDVFQQPNHVQVSRPADSNLGK